MADFEESGGDPFTRALGGRLRTARRARGWSLQDVESVSNHEFKASVLGAYERGERSISVRRLHRLATLYGVPVAQLIPGGAGPDEEEVVVDLTAAEEEGMRSELIDRFITTIQLMRTDMRGEGSAIRQSDLRVLASLLKADSERADDDRR